ncbi:MAG: hypothetical protein ABIJ61_08660 [bacterium]
MMRKSWFFGVIFTIILAIPLSLWAEDEIEIPPTEMQNHPEQTFSVPMGSWLTFTQDRKHELDFQDALRSIAAKNVDQAENELRTAGSFLKIEESRATSEGLVVLKKARTDLADLGKNLKAGMVVPVAEVEMLFGHTDYALAKHSLSVAEQEFADQRIDVAGFDLLHFVTDFSTACDWAKVEIDPQTQAELNSVQAAGGQLRLGGNFDPDLVAAAFSTGKGLLEKFAATLSPAAKG